MVKKESGARRHTQEARRELLEELLGEGAEDLTELDGVPVALPRGFGFDRLDGQRIARWAKSRPEPSDASSAFVEFFLAVSSHRSSSLVSPRVLYALRWGLRYAVDVKIKAPDVIARKRSAETYEKAATRLHAARKHFEAGLEELRQLLEDEHLGHVWKGGGPLLYTEASHARAHEIVEGIRISVAKLDDCAVPPPKIRHLDGIAPRCVGLLCAALWSSDGIEMPKKLPKRIYAAAAFIRAGLTPRQAAAVCALDVGADGFEDFGEASNLPAPADDYRSTVEGQWAYEMEAVPDAMLIVPEVQRAVRLGEMRSPSPNLINRHILRKRR